MKFGELLWFEYSEGN